MRRKQKMNTMLIGGTCMLILAGCGSPKIALTNETVNVELGSDIDTNIADYVTFQSNLTDEKKTEALNNMVLDVSEVDVNTVGEYTAVLKYSNKDYTFKVNVEDTTVPTASLVSEKLDVKTGEEIKASDLVTDIQDKQDVTVEFVEASVLNLDESENVADDDENDTQSTVKDNNNAEESNENDDGQNKDVKLTNTYTFETSGNYEIAIRLTDASGNIADLTQEVMVTDPDTIAPIISGVKNKTIYVGGSVNYMKGISATDDVDGDITDKIEVNNNEVNAKKVGTYTVTYTVKDKAGNEANASAKVTVKKKEVVAQTTPTQTASSSNTNESNTSSSSGSHSSSSSSSSSGSTSAMSSQPSQSENTGSSAGSSGSSSTVESQPSTPSQSESTSSSSNENSSSGTNSAGGDTPSWGVKGSEGTPFGGLPLE